LSRQIAVKAILLTLVLPIFALAQGAQSEPVGRIEEGAEAKNVATLTTTDTLDPKDFAKPAAPPIDRGKKSSSGKKMTAEALVKAILVPPTAAIGTAGQIAPASSLAADGTTASTGSLNIDALIVTAAAKYGLDQRLIIAVMRQESSFNPRAISPKGARGLMQLMPATARRFGVQDIYDPAQNIDGGAQYLRFLLDTFNGDVELALAGYNAGENAVIRYGHRIPPYRETQEYVQRITAHYNRLTGSAAWRGARNSSLAERQSEPELIGGARALAQY
jgi:soluble lytic murein transglycosylase-like protein